MTNEDLKCCGNCSNREAHYLQGGLIGEACPKPHLFPSCGICDDWQADNLTWKDRKSY